MAISGDVTLAQDGARLHPYLVALVRWCVSSFWSTASLIIHRLMTAPLPPIAAAAKPVKTRPASSDHLHPDPLVDCVVLHEPPTHTIDVIFVHGLYGSLGNTWRQGEWKSNYKIDPEIVTLKTHSNTNDKTEEATDKNAEDDLKHIIDSSFNFNNTVQIKDATEEFNSGILKNNIKGMREQQDFKDRTTSFKEEMANFREKMDKFKEKTDNCANGEMNEELKEMFKDNLDNVNEFYEDIKRILPNDNLFITEKFYNNTLLDQVEIVGNYESQANFVRDLFKNSCDEKNKVMDNDNESCECDSVCEVGCGCVCDKCYSPCWPRDWIKEDFPGARVISINYTSDPYLWRPLWIKEIKRLRLHERAEQMTSQLLELGVGQKPIIWVGHSKGGLFIKQIYCEAYEAYLQETKDNIDYSTNDDNIKMDYNDDTNIYANGDQIEEVIEDGERSRRACLWQKSAGFMFYSVPHRGSPLADIKTPITARSIELLEICKNCSLLLSLQDRWLIATSPLQPAVHSLVETCRTLMSVLWLRIVSVDSADPGRGALHGVSVDHREICKPTSRHCVLYKELMGLMRTAFNKS
ncbi:unnamed protein product [Leptosia nina]|uniref:Protein SERAC1 n=1 Tax=Leptosia nina TaxID=320188 RepID=A0AAV1K2I8_9NEOP